MAENETNETPTIDGELTMGVQKLSLQDSDDQTDSKDLSEKKNSSGPAAIGADEAKDSETISPEAENQPVKGRVFVGGISWRTTDVNLRVCNRVGCHKLETQLFVVLCYSPTIVCAGVFWKIRCDQRLSCMQR